MKRGLVLAACAALILTACVSFPAVQLSPKEREAWRTGFAPQPVPAALIQLNRTAMLSPRAAEAAGDEHVAEVYRHQFDHGQRFYVTMIHSCPVRGPVPQFRASTCHQSAVVVDDAGRAYVLDNGRAIPDSIFPGQALTLADFFRLTRGRLFDTTVDWDPAAPLLVLADYQAQLLQWHANWLEAQRQADAKVAVRTP